MAPSPPPSAVREIFDRALGSAGASTAPAARDGGATAPTFSCVARPTTSATGCRWSNGASRSPPTSARPARTPRAALAAGGQVDCVVRLAPTRASLGDGGFSGAVGDVERLPLADGRLDLAVSLLALQTVNDLPGALIQMRRALRPDGLLVAALLGGDTLTELRQSLTARRERGSGRRRAARRAVRRRAGARRAGAAGGPRAAGRRSRPGDRPLRRHARADARPARLRGRQRPRRPQPQADAARGSRRARPRSTRSSSPTPTGGCAPLSTWSG